MQRPDLTEYHQPSIGGVLEIDRVGQARNALLSLALGQFALPALLCDQQQGDDRVSAAFMMRCNGLLGTPLEFEPAKDTGRARKIAKLAKDHWPLMFPVGDTGEFHAWGLQLNFGVAELLWDTSGDWWIPRLRPWHPQFAAYDHAKRTYMLSTEAGIVYLPRIEANAHSDGKWVLYTPNGWRAWRRALLRPITIPWLVKQWATRDWARDSETHGKAIKKAIVPAGATTGQKNEFFDRIRNLAADPVLELPQDIGGEKWDLELLEAKGDAAEGYERLITKMETAIGVPVLGHGNTMATTGNSTVNYVGVDDAANLVRPDLKAFDALTLTSCFHQQVLYWWAHYNFGDGMLAPRPVYETKPKGLAASQSQTLNNLADALIKFKEAGQNVDGRAILTKQGVPLLAGKTPPPPPGDSSEEA